jgi:hypothetical protein
MAWKRKGVQKVESTPEFQNWLAKRRAWLAAHGNQNAYAAGSKKASVKEAFFEKFIRVPTIVE